MLRPLFFIRVLIIRPSGQGKMVLDPGYFTFLRTSTKVP